MKMIVGLGNVGSRYDGTRHNTGFMVVDELADRNQIKINKEKDEAMIGQGMIDGEKVLLVKPMTFMNDSGRAVRPLMDFYKIDVDDLVIVQDDLDMEVGRVRLRQKGSAGGHNGIKSLISVIGQDFPRVKIGVGKKPHPEYDLADWVLSRFSRQDTDAIAARWPDVAAAVELMMNDQFELAQSRYNG